MYTYIMTRTQIYLTESLDRVLARLSKETGRTKSDLIRSALEQSYLQAPDREAKLNALELSRGGWRRRHDGAAFVEGRRKGRLAALHSDDAAS